MDFLQKWQQKMLDEVPTNPQQKICKDMSKYIDPWCAPHHIVKDRFMRITGNTAWIKHEMDKYCKEHETKKERTSKVNVDDQVDYFCTLEKDATEKMDRKKIKRWINQLIKLISEEEQE